MVGTVVSLVHPPLVLARVSEPSLVVVVVLVVVLATVYILLFTAVINDRTHFGSRLLVLPALALLLPVPVAADVSL